ncbi:hypothetical protein [Sphingobacterium sp. R2]|uniref:hypothetical protein n=1 Tax=Sphingobacterium sp. R2 TaxID=3112958 RepID=UPI00345C96F2
MFNGFKGKKRSDPVDDGRLAAERYEEEAVLWFKGDQRGEVSLLVFSEQGAKWCNWKAEIGRGMPN